jgi:hypothetical protein
MDKSTFSEDEIKMLEGGALSVSETEADVTEVN